MDERLPTITYFTDDFERTAIEGEWKTIEPGITLPPQDFDHLAMAHTTMPSSIAPWLPNALMEEAHRRGAQAGDAVTGTYKPGPDGKMVLDIASVQINPPGYESPPSGPPFVSGPDGTVAP